MSIYSSELALVEGVSTVTSEVPVGALAITSNQGFWSREQKAALVQLGIEDAPNADLAIFLNQCQRTGLDPFARQIYMIGRLDRRTGITKYTIQTSIDGFRLIADRTKLYAGQTEPQWCGEDGVWHDVWVNAKPPAAARIGVYRKDFAVPVFAVAHWAEYAVTDKEGRPMKFWKQMPSHMLAKVAEALALRKTFPQDLSGLYTSDEMSASNLEAETVEVVQRPQPRREEPRQRQRPTNQEPRAEHPIPEARPVEQPVVEQTEPDEDAPSTVDAQRDAAAELAVKRLYDLKVAVFEAAKQVWRDADLAKVKDQLAASYRNWTKGQDGVDPAIGNATLDVLADYFEQVLVPQIEQLAAA